MGATIAVLAVGVAAVLTWWLGSGEDSYADRDWSALAPVAAGVPQVREPDPQVTRTTLAAIDPCAIGAAGDPDATSRSGEAGECTVTRADGTVVVHTAVTYLVDESRGLEAVNALNSRERVEIAGIAAWVGNGPVGEPVSASSSACAVVVPASLELALAIVADSADCTTVTRTAEAALPELMAGSASRGAGVFYAADEVDPGGEGGCAELGDQLAWLCAPAEERPTPEDPVDAIRRGEVDPNVLCTAALESARETDSSMVAVTTALNLQDLAERSAYEGPRQCTLLEPTQGADDRDSVTIMVTASRDPLRTNGNTTVADHPTYHSAQAGTWDVALTEVSEPGQLNIRVVRSAASGERSQPEWVEEYVADLVERLLD